LDKLPTLWTEKRSAAAVACGAERVWEVYVCPWDERCHGYFTQIVVRGVAVWHVATWDELVA
jgi:hypothetical protein